MIFSKEIFKGVFLFALSTNPAEAETARSRNIMLKHFYATEAEVPDNLKGAYEAKNGRYELRKLADDHPVVVHNKTLVTEKAAVETELNETKRKAENLERERDSLKTQVVSSDKVVIPKTELDALKTENESYKTLGTIEEIKPKVEGYDELKTTVKQDKRDKALMAAGVTDLDRARKYKSYDELDIESEIKDGKEIFYRVTKDDKGKESKVVFDNEALKSDNFKDDLGSLLNGSGTRMFRQGTGAGAANRFDLKRQELKEKLANQNQGGTFADKFNKRTVAAETK